MRDHAQPRAAGNVTGEAILMPMRSVLRSCWEGEGGRSVSDGVQGWNPCERGHS